MPTPPRPRAARLLALDDRRATPAVVKEDAGARPYLSLVERAAAAVDVPVIASLNGITDSTADGGIDANRNGIQDAGEPGIGQPVGCLGRRSRSAEWQ